jgi:hypothetical protein
LVSPGTVQLKEGNTAEQVPAGDAAFRIMMNFRFVPEPCALFWPLEIFTLSVWEPSVSVELPRLIS